MKVTLEKLFTSTTHGFGVATASPLQRAICRVIEGRPLADLADHPDVLRGIGGAGDEDSQRAALALLPCMRPTEFDIIAAIRSAKTRLACAVAFLSTQIVDVSGLAAGEVPRFSLVSLKIDAAHAAFDQLVGTVLARKALKALLLEEPTSDTIVVRHPSGRPIEIVVTAGGRAGGGLVARWSAGAFFDEHTRMLGSEDGAVVNYDDARRAVIGRLLPNAQILSAGSPWAPMGPGYDRCQESWGKPSKERVVVRGTGPMLNPVWWTSERCEAMQKSDPVAYTTDVLGEFADPEASLITSFEIKRARRAGPMVLPPLLGRRLYIAACDPGTRGNAFTLVLVGGYTNAEGLARYEIVLAKQWVGSSVAPLSPAKVFEEIARSIIPYGITTVVQDQHSADANFDLAKRAGLRLVSITVGGGASRAAAGGRDAHANRNELFERLKGMFADESLCSIPPDPVLESDLLSVRRRLTQNGVSYVLPRTGDGRHADYVPALCLAIRCFPDYAQTNARRVSRYVPPHHYMGGGDADAGPSIWTRLHEARLAAGEG